MHLKFVPQFVLITLICILAISSVEATKKSSDKVPPKQWEYAQFISQDALFQWIASDIVVTAESQQALLRRLGKPAISDVQYINDLIILNYAAELGWELVSVVSAGPGKLVYTFKRPVEKTN